MWDFPLFPERASTAAARVDAIYFALNLVGGGVGLLVAILLVWFAIRYRQGSRASRRLQFRRPKLLEVIWMTVPVFIFVGFFVWAAEAYFDMRTPPPNAMEIYVVAQQWMWKLQHPTGQREINELHVPLGRPVKLVLTSQDVIHSFYVPAFRMKMDAVPGRYNFLWFEATKTGSFHLFCAEYCGSEHSQMIGRVVVMEPAAYEQWIGPGAPGEGAVPGTPGTREAPLSVSGQGTFFRLGCNACHTMDSSLRAPRLDGLWGRQVKLRNDEMVIADADYIRQSILDPNARIVAGYPSPSLMPSYKGQVSEDQINELIEYVRSLRSPSANEEQP